MPNDLSTLSGALLEMKDELIYQLGQKGVTATYSSTDGLLGLIGRISDIQTGGGSCYHIELDESAYTTTGSLTVTATLQNQYQPYANQTVTFTGGTSTVTATTDSNGVATATVTFSASGTLTATFSNVSDTATVTVQTYLFYDEGSASGVSNYGNFPHLEGTQVNLELEYDSIEGAYHMIDGTACVLAMTGITDDVKLSVDVKAPYNYWVFLTYASSTGNGFFYGGTNNKWEGHQYQNNSWLRTLYGTRTGTYTYGTWYHLELVKVGSNVTVNCYDATGETLCATVTVTYTNDENYFGIGAFYFKNVKAEYI